MPSICSRRSSRHGGQKATSRPMRRRSSRMALMPVLENHRCFHEMRALASLTQCAESGRSRCRRKRSGPHVARRRGGATFGVRADGGVGDLGGPGRALDGGGEAGWVLWVPGGPLPLMLARKVLRPRSSGGLVASQPVADSRLMALGDMVAPRRGVTHVPPLLLVRVAAGCRRALNRPWSRPVARTTSARREAGSWWSRATSRRPRRCPRRPTATGGTRSGGSGRPSGR